MSLAPAEKAFVRLGFMRLTDSAPLILAHELGLFRQYGLEVELHREVSWANLRDRLVVGELDAAQLLSPLILMTSHGAGGLRANLLTGLSLSLNGNALTLATSLWDRLALGEPGGVAPHQSSRALGAFLDGNRDQPLTFATVHPFSSHSIQLRLWLRSGGVDPDRDLRIIVLPPEQMCDSLGRGIIDGFCVGEPWNSVAVQQGIGVVAATGYQLWNNAPEKVLGVTENWHGQHPVTHLRLRLALMEAQRRLAEPEQRRVVAQLLSAQRYLDLPRRVLLPALTGQFALARNLAPLAMPDFQIFHRYQAGFPWRSHARLLARGCADILGKVLSDEVIDHLAATCYRPDLYREAAAILNLPSPSVDDKADNTHDGPWCLESGMELGADRIAGALPPPSQTPRDA